MFGIDLEAIKAKVEQMKIDELETQHEFNVDDIQLVVSPNRVQSLHWEKEPAPEELMAAINQAFEELEDTIEGNRETAINNALKDVPEPIKSMVKKQFEN